MAMNTEIEHNLQFLGGVIHQLRNWMGGIMGHSELALSSDDPAVMAEGLNVALELSTRSTELLAALSKYSNEKIGTRGSGDLAQIGREVRLLTDNWLKKKGFGVSEKLEPAYVEDIDLPLTRSSLLENVLTLTKKIPHGETVEYRSGKVDNKPYVGFISRVDQGKPPGGNSPAEIENQGLQCKIEVKESGEFRFMIIAPPKA